jgi:hypothetical protein
MFWASHSVTKQRSQQPFCCQWRRARRRLNSLAAHPSTGGQIRGAGPIIYLRRSEYGHSDDANRLSLIVCAAVEVAGIAVAAGFVGSTARETESARSSVVYALPACAALEVERAALRAIATGGVPQFVAREAPIKR